MASPCALGFSQDGGWAPSTRVLNGRAMWQLYPFSVVVLKSHSITFCLTLLFAAAIICPGTRGGKGEFTSQYGSGQPCKNMWDQKSCSGQSGKIAIFHKDSWCCRSALSLSTFRSAKELLGIQHPGTSPSGEVCFPPGSLREDITGELIKQTKKQTITNKINDASLISSTPGNPEVFKAVIQVTVISYRNVYIIANVNSLCNSLVRPGTMQANENIQQSLPVTWIQYDFTPMILLLSMKLFSSLWIHLQTESFFKLKTKIIKFF